MNDYLCYRWRDTITDPPSENSTVVVRFHDSILVIAFFSDGKWTDVINLDNLIMNPGDEWMDFTNEVAVFKNSVQRAVNEIGEKFAGRMNHNCNCDDFATCLHIIEGYADITPQEVK